MNKKILVAILLVVLVAVIVKIVGSRGSRVTQQKPTDVADLPYTEEASGDLKDASIETTYYGTGERKSAGPIKNGVPHGEWIAWWPNGHIAWHGPMVNGKKHGEFIFYDRNGKKPERYVFENGVRISGS